MTFKLRKEFILLFICIIGVLVGIFGFFSYGYKETSDVLSIVSITPVYDENSDMIVSDDKVVFNDKEQYVSYKIVIENNSNQTVKITDVNLSVPSEEFLKYEVVGIDKNDILEGYGSKKIIINLETEAIDGWGRNFEDELITSIDYVKLIKEEDVIQAGDQNDKKEDVETPVQKPEIDNSIVVTPNVDSNNNSSNESIPQDSTNNVEMEEMEDESLDENETDDCKCKKCKECDCKFIIILLTIVYVILLIIIILFFSKYKIAKVVVLLFVLIPTLTFVKADELMKLSIKILAVYDSQNVMQPTGCVYVQNDRNLDNCQSFWQYNESIRNIYVENELSEVEGYVHKFDVSKDNNGKVMAYLVANAEYPNWYDVYLKADGLIYMNEKADFYFGKMDNLDKIYNLERLYSGEVTSMVGMFFGAGSLNEQFTLDVSSLDTSKVTDMTRMFDIAGELSSIFELDVSNFDTSNVTTMRTMFQAAGYNSQLFKLDLRNFDTSKVNDMSYMFNQAGYYSPVYLVDVSSFDTSNVTNMFGMFSGAGYSNPNFVLDVKNFDTSNVTNMGHMFNSTFYSANEVNLDLSNFDTSKVTNMDTMFQSVGRNSNRVAININSFDTSKVTTMQYMFYGFGYSAKDVDLNVSHFDTGNVSNFYNMFYFAGYTDENFNLDLSNFDFTSAVNLKNAFYNMGKNSKVLDTSITINGTNISDFTGLLTGVATKANTKFTVNYTSKTSDVIDSIIATKSSGSNVVKGVQVD